MEKVLLDTDIGSDVDDAICLAYLLANPDCELLGITTVTGEPLKRAQMASAVCRAADRDDIPIFPGAPDPILAKQHQVNAQQAVALSRWSHRVDFPQGEAIEFLRKTIRAYPREITLLTVGPLTNIGLLFRVDPEIPAMLKGLVMMSGLFTDRVTGFGPREWNAFGDPHASAVVYGANVRTQRAIGLDVTTQVVMSADEVRARFTAPQLAPVLDFAEISLKQWGGIGFHDPLAAVTIFDDQVCQFERGRVEIELESSRLAGFTYWTKAEDGPHEVAVSVHPERFFERYFSVFE